ncbi:MAG: TolB family protein, partial [Vicinamibacterales bacterium]
RNTTRVTGPSFSANGSQLAFSQVGAGVPRSVWLMNADGSSQSPLLQDESGWPSWDGNDRLLVFRGATPQTGSFWFIDSRTRRATELKHIDARGVNNPRLSPDGESIAYWKLEPGGALNTWVQPVTGGLARRVTADPESANYPVWSPDGRWLAVELKRGEETSIGVVSRDGGPIEQVTHERGQNWPHSWVGDLIFFAGERDGVWNVFTVSRRTGTIRQVTHFTSPSGGVNYPAASPDGSRVVFERTVDEGSIWTFAAPGFLRDSDD